MTLKKVLAMVLVFVMLLSLAACGTKSNPQPSEAQQETGAATTPVETQGEDQAEEPSNDRAKSACYISNKAISSDWDLLIWKGFQYLELEGWTVKCVEATDSAEWAEAIMAMGEAGYGMIFLRIDSMAQTFQEIAEEFHALYPNTYVIYIDSYLDNNLDYATAVPCDPWEPSFISGYIAAKTSKTGLVGWIAHTDTVNMRRFQYGFEAGVKYADNGTQVVTAFTGDAFDTEAGYNTAVAMMENYDVDVIQQAANLSGLGIIQACEERGIKCIGVDDWQGDESEVVFWSTIKSMDHMVHTIANMWYAGEDLPNRMSFNMASGNIPYDSRDLNNLPEDLRNEVLALCDGILDGSVDVFFGDYAEYYLGY